MSSKKSKVRPRRLSPSARSAGSVSATTAPTPASIPPAGAGNKHDNATRAKEVAEKRRRFLEAFAISGNVSAAAKAVPIHRDRHYEWMDQDPVYAQAFGRAKEEYADLVRTTVRNRAVFGWDEPVVYQGHIQCEGEWQGRGSKRKWVHKQDADGKPVPVTVRKFSERLLELEARAKCAEYREKREISGPDGGAVPIQVLTGVPQPGE